MNDELYDDYTGRLKSVRRRIRLKKTDEDKRLIGLYRELMALSKQINNLGYRELVPPVQRGWKRTFVLRQDVVRSKDAKLFQGILDKINTTEYSWRKDFKRKHRQRGKKVYMTRGQELQKFEPLSFARDFNEVEKKYFDLVLSHDRHVKKPFWVYVFREPWRFVLHIQPNVITKTRIKDFDLEQRKNEVRSYLERNKLWPRICRIIDGNYQWRGRWACGELKKYQSPLKNKPLAEILAEHWPIQIDAVNKDPRIIPGVFVFTASFEIAA